MASALDWFYYNIPGELISKAFQANLDIFITLIKESGKRGG